MEYIEIKEQIKTKAAGSQRFGGFRKSAGAWAFIPDNHASGKPVEKTGGLRFHSVH